MNTHLGTRRFIFLMISLTTVVQQVSSTALPNDPQYTFPPIHTLVDQCKTKAQSSCQQDVSPSFAAEPNKPFIPVEPKELLFFDCCLVTIQECVNTKTHVQPPTSTCQVNRVMYGTTVEYLDDGGTAGDKVGVFSKELMIAVPYSFTCKREYRH